MFTKSFYNSLVYLFHFILYDVTIEFVAYANLIKLGLYKRLYDFLTYGINCINQAYTLNKASYDNIVFVNFI